MVSTLEALGYDMISRFPVVFCYVCNFVEPRSVPDVTSDVHLFSSLESNIRKHGQENFWADEPHFIYKDQVCTLSSAGLEEEGEEEKRNI